MVQYPSLENFRRRSLELARKKKPSGRKKSKRSRSIREMYRRTGTRDPRRLFYIYCEGERTEPLYFKAMRQELRLPTIDIRVIGAGGVAITVVEKAVEELVDIDKLFDEIWCVFDTEIKEDNPTLNNAVELAKRKMINIAVSNPAFEYWYFLHFECSDRAFVNATEVRECLKHHIENYQKNVDVFEQVWERTERAIENAEILRNRSADPWGSMPNPSTSVDVLVKHILSFADEETKSVL